jgi:tRNA(Ile)-lysidine synthase
MRERDGRLARPLLAVSREETAAYCRERGLAFTTDETNSSRRYARNRVRLDLLGALREVHPAAESNVLRTLDVLRDEAAVLDAVLDAALDDAGDPPTAASLAALPPALARLAVQRLADRAMPDAPALGARAAEILGLAAAGGTATLDVGHGLRAVVSYGALRFERAGRTEAAAPGDALLDVPGTVAFAGGTLTCERGGDIPVGDGTLDADVLVSPLAVRGWRPGDRMRPLGLGGTKTVQDLFCDRKVPRGRRSRLPVVLSDGEIAWIPGVATGERFRVTERTGQRARLVWEGQE